MALSPSPTPRLYGRSKEELWRFVLVKNPRVQQTHNKLSLHSPCITHFVSHLEKCTPGLCMFLCHHMFSFKCALLNVGYLLIHSKVHLSSDHPSLETTFRFWNDFVDQLTWSASCWEIYTSKSSIPFTD